MFIPLYLFALLPPAAGLDDVTARSRRTRRAANMHYTGGTANHLEVMVVADADMARFHGEDLDNYIQMLMAEVCHVT